MCIRDRLRLPGLHRPDIQHILIPVHIAVEIDLRIAVRVQISQPDVCVEEMCIRDRILCGLARQTRGHILIDGKKARAAVRRREIYYCGNDTSTQFFTASVADELLLNTELTEESKDRARHLLKEFGLYEYRDAHPSTLSGGQKQRLAIACAIFSGRGILILDEPTSGLDGQNMRLVAERLKSEARNGRTILVITHDRELIESCCDRIAKIGVKFGEGDVA